MTYERNVGATNAIKYIDLFCGIGGFRIAMEQAAADCGIKAQSVLSSDIDEACRKAYLANFGEEPTGDIRGIDAAAIPDHDVLLAGFPCQAFSIIGKSEGFKDTTRGTLFFEIARILEAKRPKAFILENVKNLRGHDNGRTLDTILKVLHELGYSTDYRVLNALDFGLPQKRERIFIVGYLGPMAYEWPTNYIPYKSLTEILEDDSHVPNSLWASDYIKEKRKASHVAECYPSIWHENKSGNISSYPYSCALRANASYNYLLVNGERRLTPREMLRLQGFPESFKIVCSDTQTRTQAGNSLPVPVAKEVIRPILQRIIRSRRSDVESGGDIDHARKAARAEAQDS